MSVPESGADPLFTLYRNTWARPKTRNEEDLRPPRCLVGVAGFEPATSSSRTKRAAGLRHTPMSRTETMRPLGAPVSYHRHARSVERGARTSRPYRPPSANCPLRSPRSTDHGGRRSSSLRRSLPLLHLSSDAAVFPGHASAWTVFRWENLSEESVPVCVPSAIVTIDERTVSASFIE